MKVVCGTENAAKIASVKRALEKIQGNYSQEKVVKSSRLEWEKLTVVGVKTSSGVSDQPKDEHETIQGAKNRALAALQSDESADFGIGIESGLSRVGDLSFEGGWIVVVDKKGEMGLASSNRYELRKPILDILSVKGKELSDAVTMLTGLTEVKSTLGMSGVISNGLIDRSDSYIDAVILAFGPFLSDGRLWGFVDDDDIINHQQLAFKSWTAIQVSQWMGENGFQQYKEAFVKHEITGDLLLDLNYNNLGDIGVGVFGDRARILQAIKKNFAPPTPKLPLSLSGHFKSIPQSPFPSGLRSASSVTPRGMPSPTSNSAFFPANVNATTLQAPSTGSINTPSVPAKKMQNISVITGDLKSSVRAEREAALISQKSNLVANIRQNSSAKDKDSMQPKGLKIIPRSASIKKNIAASGTSTPQEELFQAVDSIFGGTTQIIPHQTTVAPVSNLVQSSSASSIHNIAASSASLVHASDSQPHSPRSPTSSRPSASLGDKDIMSMKGVREKFIRVSGLESNQSHIIKISDCVDANSIKEKVKIKFNMKADQKFSICVAIKEKVVPLDDKELMKICTTDNRHRGNLFLKKVDQSGKGSRQKVSKFFGAEISTQPLFKTEETLLKNDKTALSLFGPPPSEEGSKEKLNKFFGERPPDELIVNQLEQFFPGIHSTNESKEGAAIELQNIVRANLVNKRISRRNSSLMLRRQTRISMNLSQDLNKFKETTASSIGSSASVLRFSNTELMRIAEAEATPTSKLRPISGAKIITSSPELAQSSPNLPPATPTTTDTPLAVEKEKKPQPISFRWVPGRMIGQGAFGKVFHALNLDNGEFMAVKQVMTGQDNTQQKKMTDSLLREIELLSELDHDNIVRYFGFQEGDDNTFNVFLEYVAGGSISSVLSKCGKLDEQIARSLAAQILCGLEYLHSRDIIHRDIKGANILVTGDGIVKISDFGISKKNEYTAYHRMTRMSMQGSINWMAPEVARGKGYSAKVDIWSCGCLVLEMLTGQVPWHNVRGNVIYLLGTGNSPPLPPSLSEMAKHFLETTFTIDPEMRPTATTLLEHTFTDIDITQVDFEKWSTEAMQLRAELGSSSEPPATDQSTSNTDTDSDSDSEEESGDEGESINWGSDSQVASGAGSGAGTPKPMCHQQTRPVAESGDDVLDEDLHEMNSHSYNEIVELAESLESILAKKL